MHTQDTQSGSTQEHERPGVLVAGSHEDADGARHDTLGQRTQRWKAACCERVAAHPAEAVVVSAAVGALVSALVVVWTMRQERWPQRWW
jgi:ElaB/YqjD/DUF883 family membrane-anchored ribosome-binding protein